MAFPDSETVCIANVPFAIPREWQDPLGGHIEFKEYQYPLEAGNREAKVVLHNGPASKGEMAIIESLAEQAWDHADARTSQRRIMQGRSA